MHTRVCVSIQCLLSWIYKFVYDRLFSYMNVNTPLHDLNGGSAYVSQMFPVDHITYLTLQQLLNEVFSKLKAHFTLSKQSL